MSALRGALTYLVPFTEEHVEDPRYFNWLSDYEVIRYIGRDEYLSSLTVEDLRAYAKEMWANAYVSFFAVHTADSGQFIGTMKINFMNERLRKSGVGDLGIMIGDRAYWGKGLSIDILRTASAYAFNQLGARKLTAGAYSLNVPVIRAFLRVGFREDGRLRKQLAIGEQYCDHILLSCFESELILT